MELSPMQKETAIDNLEQTLSIQSYSGEEGKMIGYIINYLKQNEDYDNLTVTTKTEANGINLYATKGKSLTTLKFVQLMASFMVWILKRCKWQV